MKEIEKKKGEDIMKRMLFNWMISKQIVDNIEQQKKIDNYEPITPTPIKENKTIYEYWPAFDNDIPTLGIAYALYEENNVCHVVKDGVCKCYFEFEGSNDYIKTKPNNFFSRI